MPAVDPFTGLPLEVDPATLGGELGTGLLEGGGYSQEDLPLAWQLAATAPGATTTIAWNMNRVSNTIVSGGKSGSRARARPWTGGRGVTQTFSPRNYFRLNDAANIEGGGRGKGSIYSPFGFATGVGNKAMQQARRYGPANKLLARVAGQDAEVSAFSRGTFGRMAAMARIDAMDSGRLAKSLPQIGRSVSAMGGTMPSVAGSWNQRIGASASVLNTVQGSVSGRMAGVIQGSRTMRTSGQAGFNLLSQNTTGPGRIGVDWAGRALSGEMGGVARGAARFAGSGFAAGALRAAGPIGTIMLAHDVAKMFGTVAGAGARTIMEAGTNIMAPLKTGVMGAGYQDNPVAATARGRSVMAIQSSRLNARSVLGNEANMLYQRFG